MLSKNFVQNELDVLQDEVKVLENEARSLLKEKLEKFPQNSVLSLAYKLYVSDSLSNGILSNEDQGKNNQLTLHESLVLQKYVSYSTNTDFHFFLKDLDIQQTSSTIHKRLQLLDKMQSVVVNPQLLNVIKQNTKNSPKLKKRKKSASSANDHHAKNQIISLYKTQNWIDSFILQKLYRMFGVTFFPINNPSALNIPSSSSHRTASVAPYLLGIRFDLYDSISRTFAKSPHYIILKSVNLENGKQESTDRQTLIIFKQTIPNYIQLKLLEKQFLHDYDVPQVFQFAKTVSSHLRHTHKKKLVFSRISQKYDLQKLSSDPGQISVKISYDYAVANIHFTILSTGHKKPSSSTLMRFEVIMDLTNVTNVILLHEEANSFLNNDEYILPYSHLSVGNNARKFSLLSYLKKLLNCSYESFEENFNFFIDQYKIKISESNI